MSRIGKKPIIIPAGVTVKVAGQQVDVSGPKGSLVGHVHTQVAIKQEGQTLLLTVPEPDNNSQRSLWGLSRTLVNNMVVGVTEGYKKQLEINGIGFKAAVQGKDLLLNVGFSHPVVYKAPDGINIAVEKNVISISGIDKQLVGQSAAEIRAIKKPEPYKGKGIKYSDEVIRRKPGKVVKA